MSHFTCLVIGDNIENELAPYHEFECTGYNDKFVQDVDITDEFLNVMNDAHENDGDKFTYAIEYYGFEIVEGQEEVDTEGSHKFGYVIVNQDENGNPKIERVVRRTNPNAKWDWYQVGGRWTGFFKLKKGTSGDLGNPGLGASRPKKGYADSAHKGDIDWQAMRQSAIVEAGNTWDAVRKQAPMLWRSWNDIMKDYTQETIDLARNAYYSQEGIKLLRKDKVLMWVNDDVLVDRNTYCQQASDRAVVTFAVVKDGKWYERGEMGWWGVASNEMESSEWNKKFSDMIDDLPDDTLLSVVDCHI